MLLLGDGQSLPTLPEEGDWSLLPTLECTLIVPHLKQAPRWVIADFQEGRSWTLANHKVLGCVILRPIPTMLPTSDSWWKSSALEASATTGLEARVLLSSSDRLNRLCTFTPLAGSSQLSLLVSAY
jgi:hypothetical protein